MEPLRRGAIVGELRAARRDSIVLVCVSLCVLLLAPVVVWLVWELVDRRCHIQSIEQFHVARGAGDGLLYAPESVVLRGQREDVYVRAIGQDLLCSWRTYEMRWYVDGMLRAVSYGGAVRLAWPYLGEGARVCAAPTERGVSGAGFVCLTVTVGSR